MSHVEEIVVRILACSDIHNNVAAVKQLRTLEENTFDAVIVAGDSGSSGQMRFSMNYAPLPARSYTSSATGITA